jgi:hypothetical protein
MTVSAEGSALYVANSDFDLQYNGGTLQSYDLSLLRRHAAAWVENPVTADVPVLDGFDKASCAPRNALGTTCAPPVDSSFYVRDTAVIGAFATDLLLSAPPACLPASSATEKAGTRSFDRLFSAVRGNASLTWASVERDVPGVVPPADKSVPYGPFALHCGQDASHRCDTVHQAGVRPDEVSNSRHLTMPGEPFGMALSEDGRSIVVAHQNETKTSLFDTGLARTDNSVDANDNAPLPSLQFVLDGMPLGGVAVVGVPHDPDAVVGGVAPHPAFLETSRAVAEISLLRQYPDEFNGTPSSQKRPYLTREGGFPATVGPGGTDSRGIVIDPTPRLACKARVAQRPADPKTGRTQAAVDAELLACAQRPARVFVANRTPASLLVGELGGKASAVGTYDPDRLVMNTAIPLSVGPSRLYLAPVVESDGAYALRVFIVCFDSATVFVYDPDTQRIESEIRVGVGPFAMAFDPFSLEAVANHERVPFGANDAALRRYRFGYVASFTNSFIQVLDLDNAGRSTTFERIVYTVGRPTNPKGS